MATPTIADPRLLAAGAAKASEWGTAVALGANMGILIENDGGLSRSQPYVPDKAIDTPFVKEGDLGPIDPVDFSPAFTMRYDPGKLGTLIALLFGTAGAPTLVSTTLAYKHVLQWKDSIDGLFTTFAIEKPGKIYEVASAKSYALALSIADGLLKGSISLRGNTLIDDSAVNTATQMDALTYVDRENRVKFIQGSVKMNDESGGDVATEDALQISGLSLNFGRTLDSEHKAGEAKIIEPLETDTPVITIELSFPRMDSVNAPFFGKFTAETEQKMLIKFTGALIEETYYYDLAFYFPRLRVLNVGNPVAIGSVVPSSITLQAEEAASNPTGMDYARPYVEIINKQTTDYLA